MSCPCFSPTHPRSPDAGSKSLLLPLGDAFEGMCLAEPDCPIEPEESRLTVCNLGYARGDCPRFPADSSADAIRFALHRDDGQSLQIYYVLERGHHPVEHGQLLYTIAGNCVSPALPDKMLHQQAAAYAGSYLRRKARPGTG